MHKQEKQNVTRCRDSRTSKSKEARYRDDHNHKAVKYTTPHRHNTCIMKKDRGFVYLTVLCDHLYLVQFKPTEALCTNLPQDALGV